MKAKIISAISLLIMIAVLSAFFVVWNIKTNNVEPVRVDIKAGDSLSAMAIRWEKEGWLPSALLLKLQARLLNQQNVLRVGEFDVPAHISGVGLLNFLAQARPVVYKVRFTEGTRLIDAIAELEQAHGLQHDILPLTPKSIAAEIGVQNSAEGWLYPDTYVYYSGEKVSTIIRQSYQRMKNVLQHQWQNKAADLPYQTPYEALIMASIVEKETGAAHERSQIAGVFVRRLNKNMRLETDPTVIYGLGESFDGNLRKKHLTDRSNRYNSYRHRGLPPSPIAFAGEAAIKAALNPAKDNTLYFVAKGDGTHHFSSTLTEHNKAVREYQIFRRTKDYRSAPTSD